MLKWSPHDFIGPFQPSWGDPEVYSVRRGYLLLFGVGFGSPQVSLAAFLLWIMYQ